MPQNSEQGEPGRVHAVGEVKIGLSRRDLQSLLLVRRRLQAISDECRFATPSEIRGLFDVISGALPATNAAVWNLVSRETEMITYGSQEDDVEDEGEQDL